MLRKAIAMSICCLSLAVSTVTKAEEIGSVDTKFILLGPDHEIEIEAFDDPKISGVACYLSKAKTGGIKGALGVAEDTSDASISCRQIGPVEIREPFDEGERVFKERRSLVFKKLQVVRFCDQKRNAIIYLVYSETLVDGSPKNAITAVPIMPWGGIDDGPPLAECKYDD